MCLWGAAAPHLERRRVFVRIAQKRTPNMANSYDPTRGNLEKSCPIRHDPRTTLIKRCIEAASKPGDFIFDPFAGSATTGVAAANLGRKFCGIEMQQEFIGLAIKRLVDATAKANWS